MRKLFALVVVCLSAMANASVSVSGNLQDLTGTAVTSRTFVRFIIRGCAGNQARFTGTASLTPNFQDFTPDNTGAFTGTLFDSLTEISCGGSVGNTWYGVVIYRDGKPGPEVSYNVTGASFNLNSATPNTTSPVVSAPTGDSTYQRLDGGNNASGSYIPSADNTKDLGGVAAAWRTGYFKTSIVFLGTTISTKTGSGAMVLGSSPTITSPVLSTPVLGVATGTSLNLGATGTLSTTAQSGTGSLCMTTNCVMTTPTIGVASGSSLNLDTAGFLSWNSDTGLSRGAGAEVDCGNGTQGNKTCVFKAASAVFTGNVNLGSCTGCTPAILFGACSGAATASSTLGIFGLGEMSATTCTGAYSSPTEIPMPSAGTIKNLRVVCALSGTNASSGAFTVRKNTATQSLTCTVGTGNTCSDTSGSFGVAAGDTVGIQFTTQVGETLSTCRASIEKI